MNRETIAGVLARFQVNFDPRRYDATAMEAAIATWEEQLWHVNDAAGMAAADVILRDDERHGPAGFPTVGDFRRICQRLTAADLEPTGGADSKGDCLTCRGTGVVWDTETRPAVYAEQTAAQVAAGEERRVLRPEIVYEYTLPCPMCDPGGWQYAADGHWHASHDVTRCDHTKCKARAEHYAKTRHR